MAPRIYLETSLSGYLTVHPAPDLYRAARQQLTRGWWAVGRQSYELCISPLVIEETEDDGQEGGRVWQSALRDATVLEMTGDARALAKAIVDSGILPANATSAASHIAVAAVHEIPYLLTWNHKHIANGLVWRPLERLCSERGVQFPTICTPQHLMGMHTSDPIVEEIHRHREAYAARFNYDLDAIFRDNKERVKASGRFFTLPPATPSDVNKPLVVASSDN